MLGEEIGPYTDDRCDTSQTQDIYMPGIKEPLNEHTAPAAERGFYRFEVHSTPVVEILVEYVDCDMSQQSPDQRQSQIESVYGIGFVHRYGYPNQNRYRWQQ